jgi:hypothetical protein
MSLPVFSTQSELFSTAALSGTLFPEDDRYRLFGKLIYPQLAGERATLEPCYCAANGRTAVEPVLLLGVSLLQELDGLPDRLALEMLRYHAGWNFALNRQLGDALFHPTTLVNFRHRLKGHQLSALGFETILKALEKAGLISRQSRQRLDSTQMFGRVARMSRLDCVRETLRLALQELEAAIAAALRPPIWPALWERYVESQTDYRASTETLARKLTEAGNDAWQLLEWLRTPALSQVNAKPQAQLLARVFAEQFQILAGTAAPLDEEKQILSRPAGPETEATSEPAAPPLTASVAPMPEPAQTEMPYPSAAEPVRPAQALAATAEVRPRDKEQLDSARVQNPHDPEAAYAAKGKGEQKKEHVGYKVQIAESVCEATLAAGEPTRNFILGIVTHPAYEHDETGAQKMEQEQAQMGWEKPPVLYVDAAYVSAQKLAQAQAEGREIIGPALPSRQVEGRFTATDFQVNVEQRQAICPAGKSNTQCSRLVEQSTGKVSYRFEFGAQCHDCSLRRQCFGQEQRHRSLVVGEHHTLLQKRRQEQRTLAFQERMNHRNAIEGTQSELVRAHGLRHARYRGLAKTKLQNYFIGAACNAKRWIRCEAWKLRQAALTSAAPMVTVMAG